MLTVDNSLDYSYRRDERMSPICTGSEGDQKTCHLYFKRSNIGDEKESV
jgi:hypothetical protein